MKKFAFTLVLLALLYLGCKKDDFGSLYKIISGQREFSIEKTGGLIHVSTLVEEFYIGPITKIIPEKDTLLLDVFELFTDTLTFEGLKTWKTEKGLDILIEENKLNNECVFDITLFAQGPGTHSRYGRVMITQKHE